MLKLNKDIILLIAENLELQDILKFSSVHQQIQKYLTCDHFWNRLAIQHFGKENIERIKEEIEIRPYFKIPSKQESESFVSKDFKKYKTGIGLYSLCTELNDIKNYLHIKGSLLNLFDNYMRCNLSKISIIPESICHLKHLKQIDLSHNSIELIPEEFFQLVNLEELDLYYNCIKEISENIVYLEKLKHLDLANNRIEKIPRNIGNLKNLKKLYLQCNRFKYENLPIELIYMEKLEILNIRKSENFKEFSQIQEITSLDARLVNFFLYTVHHFYY
jgi:Leucine-rich repeat (LRR) protein